MLRHRLKSEESCGEETSGVIEALLKGTRDVRCLILIYDVLNKLGLFWALPLPRHIPLPQLNHGFPRHAREVGEASAGTGSCHQGVPRAGAVPHTALINPSYKRELKRNQYWKINDPVSSPTRLDWLLVPALLTCRELLSTALGTAGSTARSFLAGGLQVWKRILGFYAHVLHEKRNC